MANRGNEENCRAPRVWPPGTSSLVKILPIDYVGPMPASRAIAGLSARRLLTIFPCLILFTCAPPRLHGQTATPPAGRPFQEQVQPLVQQYCLRCHSTEKHKGDLDLERFTSQSELLKHPQPWEKVIEELSLGEMPPEGKPHPTPDERVRLIDSVNALLEQAAVARAGDPGPIVLRRLNNAEYTYTIRDLTGVNSLDPAREFPGDSAAGEGFMNTGSSLVMSPALLTKYFDAAKSIAAHAVLLPDGIRFSPRTTPRDWTDETLAAIRAFYARFTKPGGGTSVNLQGIKFDTKDGGVLPLENYLEATLLVRDQLAHSKATERSHASVEERLRELAVARRLSPKYLTTLWTAIHATTPSLLLDSVRRQWRGAQTADTARLAGFIEAWQQALWHFTTVGQIGKRGGPTAWQERVTPLASAREVRMKLPPPAAGDGVTLYLVASDAGDGSQHDVAVWENPRLVAPGRPDLLLRDVRSSMNALTESRQKVFTSAAPCLAAANEISGDADEITVARLAQQHGVEPVVLRAWLDCLGIGGGEARIDGYMTNEVKSAQGYDFITGWAADNALSVIANSSDQHVRVPGNMKPHSVAAHPSPSRRVIITWRSPISSTISVDGSVQHAHTECGNGVTWALEFRRGHTRQRLAAGVAQDAREIKFGPFENLAVQTGDLLSITIGPRDGNHACDLTAIELAVTDGTHKWNLADDVAPDILAGNPHSDRLGHTGVWHFHSEPDTGGGPDSVLPGGSLLARWQASGDAREKQRIAERVQALFLDPAAVPNDTPDGALYRLLASPTGPLLSGILRHIDSGPSRSTVREETTPTPAATRWGLDPSRFGRAPNHDTADSASLWVTGPSVLEVRLPAELVEGCEFVATARLDQEAGAEGSVQMRVLTTKPPQPADATNAPLSTSPILAADGSAARERIGKAFEDFRQLFPAALCYTKIVPVDEVITLTLFYREDNQLRRLMLDDAQAAELDRLWSQLHYISQDALKLVDAFDQLWQFATQDSDPTVLEPLRLPIRQQAETFRKLLVETEPAHLAAVLRFAQRAYRRPLTTREKDELSALYRKLRAEEIPHAQAIRLVLARTLVAPAFLYRTEQPPDGKQPGPVNDWELATRLSYFLWSSAPDAELSRLAGEGKLRDPDVLAAQARRMLRDDRVRRLAVEFGCAWLHIHDFESLDEKSERHFPTFAALRGPLFEEAVRFLTDVFQNDASVMSLFDTDHTFLNETLAKYYGIPGVAGPGWRRVDGVKQYGRGGILGLGATLAKQSGASRTSPILRGNWIAEVLLGDKLPRPPKDVPRLPEDEAAVNLTVRELTERHTSDPRCYSCHRHIDGYGFALEAYDAIGRFRTRDLGGRPIDTRAKVFDGTVVAGAQGLRDYLLTKKRDAVLSQFNRKLLGYSLGRAVILSDRPLLKEMRRQLEARDYHFSAAVEAIVRSPQFREIRGRDFVDEE